MNPVAHSEFAQNLSRGLQFNIFSFTDHTVVKRAMARLEDLEYDIVRLRFWENNTIQEIAEILDLSWDEVDRSLTQAFEKLRSICLTEPEFSRSNVRKEIRCQSQVA